MGDGLHLFLGNELNYRYRRWYQTQLSQARFILTCVRGLLLIWDTAKWWTLLSWKAGPGAQRSRNVSAKPSSQAGRLNSACFSSRVYECSHQLDEDERHLVRTALREVTVVGEKRRSLGALSWAMCWVCLFLLAVMALYVLSGSRAAYQSFEAP